MFLFVLILSDGFNIFINFKNCLLNQQNVENPGLSRNYFTQLFSSFFIKFFVFIFILQNVLSGEKMFKENIKLLLTDTSHLHNVCQHLLKLTDYVQAPFRLSLL